MNSFGLDELNTSRLMSILESHSCVSKAVIFGSRARNTFKVTSDIDIAIWTDLNSGSLSLSSNVISSLKADFEDSLIPYTVDLIDYQQLSNQRLKEEIDCYGKVFYLRGWVETSLGEVVEIIGGGTPKTTVGVYWNGDIPWLSVVDFNDDNRWVSKTEKTITEKGLKESSTKVLNAGDLIISARGTVGALAQLKTSMAFNQSCYGIKEKENISDKNFLYYLIKQSVSQIGKNVHGAVFDTITRETFNHIKIFQPPLPEQKAIAAVLSSLDDKVELLREQNKTLETIAQVLFKEWFVDFNFPDENGEPYKKSGGKMVESELGEIPEGWRVGRIEDLAIQLSSGGTPATQQREYYDGDINWFSTKELQDQFLFKSEKKITCLGLENSSAKLFPENTVIMAIYAAPTVGRLGILTEESSFNQAAVGLIAKMEIGYPFVFLLLKYLRNELNGLANGAAQQNLNVGIVKNYKVGVPCKLVIEHFKNVIYPIFTKIRDNSEQIQSLTRSRDELLPRLIKGEVRVVSL
jgi:type I restriction enzyme, S subunit